MEEVIKAIQQKYGVSEADSKKVVDALVTIEKSKRSRTSAQPKATRASKAAKPPAQSKGLLDDLAGGLLGGGQSGQNDELLGLVGGLLGGSQQGGDLSNLVGGLLGGQQGGDLSNLVGGLLGGQQQGQGNTNLLGIVNDLINNPSVQGAGLAGIVGGLLAGQGNTDVMGVVNGLLGGSTPSQPTTPSPAPTQTAADRLRQLGADAKKKPLKKEIGSNILNQGGKKKK